MRRSLRRENSLLSPAEREPPAMTRRWMRVLLLCCLLQTLAAETSSPTDSSLDGTTESGSTPIDPSTGILPDASSEVSSVVGRDTDIESATPVTELEDSLTATSEAASTLSQEETSETTLMTSAILTAPAETTETSLVTSATLTTLAETTETSPVTRASTTMTTTTTTLQSSSSTRKVESTSMEARVTSHKQGGGVDLVSGSPAAADPQAGRVDAAHGYTRDKKTLDESVYDIMFVQQAPLFISLIVVGAICLAIILCGILYLRCHTRTRDDYLAPRKDEEKAGLDNPLSDKDILANEGLMLERHNSMLTGSALTKTDEEGWIVPLSELSEDMKKALEIQDTRF